MRAKAMKNQSNRPHVSLNNCYFKDTNNKDELIVFFEFLSDKVTSCTDASQRLNIPQKHLTRYKRLLEEKGLLQVVKKHRCSHTGRRVQFITTDKSQFVHPIQLHISFSKP